MASGVAFTPARRTRSILLALVPPEEEEQPQAGELEEDEGPTAAEKGTQGNRHQANDDRAFDCDAPACRSWFSRSLSRSLGMRECFFSTPIPR